MTRGLRAAIVVWGCGHAAPAPVPSAGLAGPRVDAALVVDSAPPDAAALDADPTRLAARTIELLRACGQAVVAASDCADAVARLNAVLEANHEVIDANARVLHAQGAVGDALRHTLDARASEVADAGRPLVDAPIAKQCAGDTTFRATLDRLRGQP